MLTDAMFWRLVWKEYRVQRKLWLAMVVLTPVVQLCPLLLALLWNKPVSEGVFVGIALAATAVYMLGCGATLFATERELETFDFQRSLPVDAWRVFTAKSGFALASGCGLLAVLTVATFVLFVRQWLLHVEQYYLVGLVATVEVFAWGVCFSLLLRRPLWAAFFGVLVPSAIIGNLLPGATTINWSWSVFEYHQHYLAPRAALAGVVFAMDAWLAWLWFNGRLERLRWAVWWPRRAALQDPEAAANQSLPTFQGGRRAGWSRLFWLVGRQSRWIAAAMLTGYLIVLYFSLKEAADLRTRHPPYLLFPTFLASVGFGLCAFTLDQARQQFRWFAERGISARRVWLSRKLVWLPLVLAFGAGLALVVEAPRPAWHADIEWAGLVSVCLWMPLTWYAVGQFCAMFIRSTLVATVTSLVLAVLAASWNGLMVVGDVPLAWSVAPIPVVLLVATWLHVRDWVEERWNRRVALRLAVVLGTPALLLAIAVPMRRAYQIPLVDPGFSVAEFTRPLTPVEQETLDLYYQAWQAQRDGASPMLQLKGHLQSAYERQTPDVRSAQRRQLLDARRTELTLLKRARDHASVPLTLLVQKLASQHVSPRPSVVWGFVNLLLLQAEELEDAGDLDGAWQQYDMSLEILRRLRLRASAGDIREADWAEAEVLRQLAGWAAKPQQTRQRIQVALIVLEAVERQGLTGDSAAKRYHVALLSALRGAATELADNDPWLPGLRNWGVQSSWLPVWERQRIERLLNHATQASLTGQARQAATIQAGAVSRWDELPPLTSEVMRFSASTWFPDVYHCIAAGYMTGSLLERTINGRGTRILLALADWRREHGALPNCLDALVGPYFDRLPVDPATGELFLYFPQGIPEEIGPPRFGGFSADESEMPVLLTAGRPFLWSPGARLTVRRIGPDQWEFRDYLGHVLSRSEGLALGRLLPVPLPAEE